MERKPCLSGSFFISREIWLSTLVTWYLHSLFFHLFSLFTLCLLKPFCYLFTPPYHSLFISKSKNENIFLSQFTTRILRFHVFFLFYSSLNSLYYYVLILVLKWFNFFQYMYVLFSFFLCFIRCSFNFAFLIMYSFSWTFFYYISVLKIFTNIFDYISIIRIFLYYSFISSFYYIVLLGIDLHYIRVFPICFYYILMFLICFIIFHCYSI